MISNVIYKHKRNACSNTKTKSEWHEIATVVEILQCANKSATSGNHSLFDYYHHSSPAGQRPPHQQLTIEEAAAGLPHLSLSLSLSFSLSSFFLIFCHFIPTFFPLTISTSIKTKRNYSKRKTKKEGKKKTFWCQFIFVRWDTIEMMKSSESEMLSGHYFFVVVKLIHSHVVKRITIPALM